LSAALAERTAGGLALLEELVAHESHVSRPAGVRAVADVVCRELATAGFACERVPPARDAGHERWLVDVMYACAVPGDVADAVVAHRPDTAARVLVLGDLDTAHAPGSLARNPFRVSDGRAYGPGVADMKGGLAVLCLALRALADSGLAAPTVTVVLSPDEQGGSLFSRPLIEAQAGRADFCLCLECARDGGKLLASRAQVGVARMDVFGQEAYAGAGQAGGASAIGAIAAAVPAIDALTDAARGVYVTTTLLEGGRRRSVVPGYAACTIDVRAPDGASWTRAADALAAIARELDRPPVRATLRAHAHRPAVPWHDGLVGVAGEAARALGLEVGAARSPAAGSSAFAAAAGVPTLDGMGPCGGGLMTDGEYVEVASLTERAALLALTLHLLAQHAAMSTDPHERAGLLQETR
jgi:glutamate carboxypeptidase